MLNFLENGCFSYFSINRRPKHSTLLQQLYSTKTIQNNPTDFHNIKNETFLFYSLYLRNFQHFRRGAEPHASF